MEHPFSSSILYFPLKSTMQYVEWLWYMCVLIILSLWLFHYYIRPFYPLYWSYIVFSISAPIAIGLRVIYPPRLQWQYQGQMVKKTTFDKNVQIGQNIMPLKLPCVKYCRDWLCSGSNRCILRNSRWWGISWQQVSKRVTFGGWWCFSCHWRGWSCWMIFLG